MNSTHAENQDGSHTGDWSMDTTSLQPTILHNTLGTAQSMGSETFPACFVDPPSNDMVHCEVLGRRYRCTYPGCKSRFKQWEVKNKFT